MYMHITCTIPTCPGFYNNRALPRQLQGLTKQLGFCIFTRLMVLLCNLQSCVQVQCTVVCIVLLSAISACGINSHVQVSTTYIVGRHLADIFQNVYSTELNSCL